MFDDSFTQLEDGAAAKMLDLLNPHLDGSPFDTAVARILSHDLPFYPGYQLIEVTDYDVNPPRQISFICNSKKQGDIYILNGTNEPIYNLNKSIPITLDEKIIFLYVRFFFYYVRGRFGRFIIVENIDEVDWKEEPAPAGKRALGKMITPLTLKTDEADEYQLNASIIFKASLFESDIAVSKTGEINLSNQELLVEDIPVLDDTFQQ